MRQLENIYSAELRAKWIYLWQNTLQKHETHSHLQGNLWRSSSLCPDSFIEALTPVTNN